MRKCAYPQILYLFTPKITIGLWKTGSYTKKASPVFIPEFFPINTDKYQADTREKYFKISFAYASGLWISLKVIHKMPVYK